MKQQQLQRINEGNAVKKRERQTRAELKQTTVQKQLELEQFWI